MPRVPRSSLQEVVTADAYGRWLVGEGVLVACLMCFAAFVLVPPRAVEAFLGIVAGAAVIVAGAAVERYLAGISMRTLNGRSFYDYGSFEVVAAKATLLEKKVRDVVRRTAEVAGIPSPRTYLLTGLDARLSCSHLGRGNGQVGISMVFLVRSPKVLVPTVAREVAHVALGHSCVARRVRVIGGMTNCIGFAAVVLLVLLGVPSLMIRPAIGTAWIVRMVWHCAIIAAAAAAVLYMQKRQRRQLSRLQQFAADEYAAELCGGPVVVADALWRTWLTVAADGDEEIDRRRAFLVERIKLLLLKNAMEERMNGTAAVDH